MTDKAENAPVDIEIWVTDGYVCRERFYSTDSLFAEIQVKFRKIWVSI